MEVEAPESSAPTSPVRSAAACPECGEKFPSKGKLRTHIAGHKPRASPAASTSSAGSTGRLRSSKASDSPVPEAPLASKRSGRSARRAKDEPATDPLPVRAEEDEEIPDDPVQPTADASPAKLERRASFHCKDEECPAVFSEGRAARRHWDKEHSPEKHRASDSPDKRDKSPEKVVENGEGGPEYASDSCKICGKTFCGSFNVRRHIIRVHGIVLPKLKPGRKKGVKLKPKVSEESGPLPVVVPKDGVIACPASVCSRTFERDEDLQRHFKLFHARKLAPPVVPKAAGSGRRSEGSSTGGQRRMGPPASVPKTHSSTSTIVSCDACGKTFRDGYNLRRHEIAVHIKGGTPHRSRKRNAPSPSGEEEEEEEWEAPRPAPRIPAPRPVKMYSAPDEDEDVDVYQQALLNVSREEKWVECEICEEAFPGSRELHRHELKCLRKWSNEEMKLDEEEPQDLTAQVKAERREDETEWTDSGRPRRAATERRASTDWTAIPHFCMLCGQVFPSDGKVATHLKEVHKASPGLASPTSRVAALLSQFQPSPSGVAFRTSASSAFRPVKPTPPPEGIKEEDEEEEEAEAPSPQPLGDVVEEEEEEEADGASTTSSEPRPKKKRRGRTEFSCELCQKACRDRYAYKKHMLAHDTGTARGPNNATLLRAGLDPGEVRAKLREAKEAGVPLAALHDPHAKAHACDRCQEGFANRQELLVHKAFCA